MPPLSGTNLPSVILLASGLICLLAGLRAIQLGRRTTYFRHRRDRVLAGWWLLGGSLLLIVIGVNVYHPGSPLFALPQPLLTASPPATPMTVTPTATPRPFNPLPTQTRPTSPSVTAQPVIPLSIEALASSSVTPGPEASITEIKFSTEMEGFLARNPSVAWRNPIKQMYAAFVYRGMTPGAQWTVLWFRNGSLVYFETRPWEAGERGRSFSLWRPDLPYEWLPGEYEVQFFVGNQWKASAGFTLTGNPVKPTPTLTPRPTRIPSHTPPPTHTPVNTPTPAPTKTPRPSRTPTFTTTPSRTPTFTFTPTRTPTLTLTFTLTPSRTPTPTPRE